MRTKRDGPKPKANDEIELHSDAWERFTEFVKRIAKAGPQHRTKPQSTTATRQAVKPQRSKSR
jgi:hypothetical protein